MLTVILSHGPSENPAKRELEAFLVGELCSGAGHQICWGFRTFMT